MSLGKGQKISKAYYFALDFSKSSSFFFFILPYGRLILAKEKLAKYTMNLIQGPKDPFLPTLVKIPKMIPD